MDEEKFKPLTTKTLTRIKGKPAEVTESGPTKYGGGVRKVENLSDSLYQQTSQQANDAADSKREEQVALAVGGNGSNEGEL